MDALTTALLAAVGIIFVIWASRHFTVASYRRKAFVLDEGYEPEEPVEPGQLPRVSVVVAAKDEETNIGRCVNTMLEQEYPNFEVVVANDRSADNTAAIVERIAEHDGRLRLINIGELPDGWCGKNNAMQTAIAQTDGEWICMIDADCRQTSTATLAAAVQYAIAHGADLLSVLPNLEMKGFWENVVQPVCGGIMMIWFLPDKVNDPERPHAYANGAFMLIRRSAYEAIGTHEAVKDQVNEDMHMAARIKAAGLRLRVVRNEGLYLVRMYTSLREIIRGWSRIFYGTFGTLKRLMISLALLTFMGLLPYVAAAFGWIAWATGGRPLPLALAIAATAAAAMQITVIYSFRKLAGGRQDQAWTYPIGCAVATGILLCAMGKLRKGAQINWRNTTYTRGQE